MRTYYIMLFYLLTPLVMNSQTQNCEFKITGLLVDKYNISQSNQEVKVTYIPFRDAPKIVKNITSGSDGRFSICLDVKSPSEILIEISNSFFQPFSRKLNKPLESEGDLGTIELLEFENLETPNPTEDINIKSLLITGQSSLGKAMHFFSAGFNSTIQPISDGSAHFNPTDYHNLGSSRTLLMVNGIRKNFAANIHVNEVPNKGEVGVDIESIPLFALENIEIKKQDASTIYGSDAIGGIIDFQLKKYSQELTGRVTQGSNFTNFDGVNYGLDLNKSFRFGEKSFVNFTYSYFNQNESNRANSPVYDSLYTAGNLPAWKSWVDKNPDLGMRIGEPQMTKNSVFYNTEIYFSKDSEDKFYSFGGITSRFTKSYANYRAPYWVSDPDNIFSTSISDYNGFLPTLESSTLDNFFVFGYKGRVSPSGSKSQFEYNVNQTVSNNSVDFYVNDSYNPSLGADSPTSFYSGGFGLQMNDTKGSIIWTPSEILHIDFGAEYRYEKYAIKAGEEDSYEGEGTISYPGTSLKNSLEASRNTIAGYIDLNINQGPLQLNASGRYEKYYNFPENRAFKASFLYNIVDVDHFKFLLRGSYSTGFRAPALQQIYYGRIQTIPQGPNLVNRGFFNSKSSVVRQLGVEPLKSEKSKNLYLGLGANWDIDDLKRLKISFDYYQISVDDRIALTSTVDGSKSSDTTLLLKRLLKSNNISSMNFFINALNTKTSGVDLLLTFRNSFEGKKTYIEARIDANFTIKNEISSLENVPKSLTEANVDIFDRRAQSILLYSRPQSKILASATLGHSDNWQITLSANYFGKVRWQHPLDSLTDNTYLQKDQVFKGKCLFNLSGTLKVSKFVSLTVSANNILNTYPDELDPKGDFKTNLGGRFKYYRELNQFGYYGASYFAQLNVNIGR
jgi:iron complex outermembrane receptor protein